MEENEEPRIEHTTGINSMVWYNYLWCTPHKLIYLLKSTR